MYQLTAVCFDAEIAYAEAESFAYALEQLLEDIQGSDMYPVESTELLMLNPDGMTITAPLSLYL